MVSLVLCSVGVLWVFHTASVKRCVCVCVSLEFKVAPVKLCVCVCVCVWCPCFVAVLVCVLVCSARSASSPTFLPPSYSVPFSLSSPLSLSFPSLSLLTEPLPPVHDSLFLSL